jgi:solute carrier family 25 folate transporter 32
MGNGLVSPIVVRGFNNPYCANNFGFAAEERQWVSHIAAAMSAGACSTMVTNPIWVIKTRMMSQASSSHHHYNSPWQYKSTLDAARQMYKNEGFLTFYSGLAPALLGLTHVAVQFPLYELFKRLITGDELGQRGEGQSIPYFGIITASCLSKVCASTATYPHEVLRTRLQTQQRSLPKNRGALMKAIMIDPSRPSIPSLLPGSNTSNSPRYRGIVQTVRTILREEGWRAFYAGMGTSMIRAVPASATTLLTYEIMVELFLKKQQEGKTKLGLES